MDMRINGFRAGVMAALMVIGGAGCKRAHYVPMPKENISPKMEQVVDSFYKMGETVRNNPEYELIHRDTIRFRNVFAEKPNRLKRTLTNLEIKDKYPTDENDFLYLNYIDPKYVVSSKDIFTINGKTAYIALEEYDKVKK